MSPFIYQVGVWTVSIGTAWAAFALVNLIERGPRK